MSLMHGGCCVLHNSSLEIRHSVCKALLATAAMRSHAPTLPRACGTADASCVRMQMQADIGMTDAQVSHAVLVYRSML